MSRNLFDSNSLFDGTFCELLCFLHSLNECDEQIPQFTARGCCVLFLLFSMFFSIMTEYLVSS